MIQVTLDYHNILRRASRVEQETIALSDGTSLYAALESAAERHGGPLREMLFAADGGIAPHLVVFLNGQLASGDTRTLLLGDGDALMLFPAISGG
jgi:molybdopterin converting factor small subunit